MERTLFWQVQIADTGEWTRIYLARGSEVEIVKGARWTGDRWRRDVEVPEGSVGKIDKDGLSWMPPGTSEWEVLYESKERK